MMRLLFWLFGKAIRRHIAQDRPRGMAGLERAFSGLDGKDYFGWPDVGQMPPVRQKHIERCLAIANAGISEKTLEELCDMADAANMDAMKAESAKDRAKAHSRIAFVLGEIRNRPKNVIPEDVYYDLAACFAIREDEDARAFDPVTHGEKIEMLRKAGRGGADFFGQLSGFRKLVGLSLTTEGAFIELLSSWTSQRTRMQAVLERYGKPSTVR